MNYIGAEPDPPVPPGPSVVLVGDTNPIGMLAYFHAVPVAGWLQLNGQGVSKTLYADLWAYAQAFLTADQDEHPGLYRSVDANTCAVPNLSSLFIRSTGGASAALGVKQSSNNLAHAHALVGGAPVLSGGGINVALSGGGGSNMQVFGSNATDSQGLSEARPDNVAFIPCVKAMNTAIMPAVAGFALQADMEAGTAADKVVTPSVQKFAIGVAKVLCDFSSTGAVSFGYGVSSVTDNGTGDWTVNFVTSFTSDAYVSACWGAQRGSGSNDLTYNTADFDPPTASKTRVRAAFSAVLNDPAGRIKFAAFGDLP